MSMYQQKNSMGLGLGGWCVEERDNSVVCPKPRRLGLSDPSFHDHHFRPSLRWPIMYVQIPLYSFPYMKNKFLFFLLLLLLFCFSDFGVGFFAVKFSVIKLRSEIQKQERSFWILFSQRFISLSLSLSVRGILLISIISFVCSICELFQMFILLFLKNSCQIRTLS